MSKVLAPETIPPAKRFCRQARPTETKSTPGCCSNRSSSTAIVAFLSQGEISSRATGSRHCSSPVNERASGRPSRSKRTALCGKDSSRSIGKGFLAMCHGRAMPAATPSIIIGQRRRLRPKATHRPERSSDRNFDHPTLSKRMQSPRRTYRKPGWAGRETHRPKRRE